MDRDRIKLYVTSYSEEVTGSNNYVKVKWPDGREVSFVVDCGLFQEKEYNHINSLKFPYNPVNVSFAIATHAHTDHVGRFPYLCKLGFKGKIYASYETSTLLPVVLSETAERLADDYRLELKKYKLEKANIKRLKKSFKGRGRKDIPRREKDNKKKKSDAKNITKKFKNYPTLIYTDEDINLVVNQLCQKPLNHTFMPCEGIEIAFYPNAHISGAVLTVCRFFDENEELYMLFTGDLNLSNPITNVVTDVEQSIKDKINIILSESTYAITSSDSKKFQKQVMKHREIIKQACKKGNDIFYMSNALERPLRVCKDLKNMQSDSEMAEYMNQFDIFFDSSFGVKCLKKYLKLHGKDYLPDNFKVLDKNNRQELLAESERKRRKKMIICTSPRLFQGSFLNYGARIIEDQKAILIFVAYVTEDVRNIIELPVNSTFKFLDTLVTKKCKMYQLGYFTSHIQKEDMDRFISTFPYAKVLLFNHGTFEAKQS